VAYDVDLADRIRDVLGAEPELTEKKMFGGLAFLLGGHLAVAASGQGGLLVRVDPAVADDLLASTSAEPMEMRGRPMPGWLRVPSVEVSDEADLERWVALATSFVATLPPKR
jgi:TfoX/Sxy family transcriptional regulator of competence genes